MRTITTTTDLYYFHELSEEVKQRVMERLYDINMDFEWWDGSFDDASTIGLKIETFRISRGEITGHLIYNPTKVKQLVMEHHGESCETYQYVMQFDMRTNVDNHDFEYGLLQEYLSILQKECEYQASEEAVIETILANEYEFDIEGNLT